MCKDSISLKTKKYQECLKNGLKIYTTIEMGRGLWEIRINFKFYGFVWNIRIVRITYQMVQYIFEIWTICPFRLYTSNHNYIHIDLTLTGQELSTSFVSPCWSPIYKICYVWNIYERCICNWHKVLHLSFSVLKCCQGI